MSKELKPTNLIYVNFKELEGREFRGEIVSGTLASSEQVVTKYGPQTVHTFTDAKVDPIMSEILSGKGYSISSDEPLTVKVNGNKTLNDDVEKVGAGSKTKLIYGGRKESKNGFNYFQANLISNAS